MAKSQVKSVAELRGKLIGMVRFGDTVELATRIALSREGLDPQKDVIPIMIGLPTTRIAALAAGSIDATIAVPPDNVSAAAERFSRIALLGRLCGISEQWLRHDRPPIDDKRDLTKRTLRALYRGLDLRSGAS